MMCWHKWSKWQEIVEEKDRLATFGKYTETVWYQKRICSKCGFLDIRKVCAI